MIEEYIEQHIKEKLAEAYPGFPEDQVIILITGGDMVYSEGKGRKFIGTEVLKISIIMSSEKAFDRKPFILAFPRGGQVMYDKTLVWQEYKRYEISKNIEAAKNVTVVFFIEYRCDIEVD